MIRTLLPLVFTLALAANTRSQNAGCLLFDGIDDRVTASDTALDAIGLGDFTVEAWVRGDEALQGQHPRIVSNRPYAGAGFMFFFHDLWGGSQYKMLSVQLDGQNYLLIDNGMLGASLLDDSCHHVAATRTGGILSFYADGALLGTKVIQVANPTVASTAQHITIGHDVVDNYSFNGNISQVRIWQHARTQAEIQADMGTSIPGDTPGLAGYWELDEGIGQQTADRTLTADAVLGTTDAMQESDPLWEPERCPIERLPRGKCLTFDGVDDRATVPNTALNAIGLGDMTVEAWVRGEENAQGQHARIVSNRPYAGAGFMLFFHDLWGGSQYKMLAVQFEGMNYLLIDNGTASASLLDGTCHHVAVARAGTTLSFYADGALLGTKLIQTANPTAASSEEDMTIGHDVVDNYSFNGNISQVRIWDHARSQAEIQADLAWSIPGNTPGLAGYWELNDGMQAVSDKTGTADGTLGTTASIEGMDASWANDCCTIDVATTVASPTAGNAALLLYPVPATDELWIDAPPTAGPVYIAVRDALGKTVASQWYPRSGRCLLSVSHLRSGIYFLTVVAGEVRHTSTFVKER